MLFEPTDENIRTAAVVLQDGGLVAFPTETVYGLGADAYNEFAVKRIYEVKGRPSRNPLIVHTADIESAFKLIDPSASSLVRSRLEKLAKFWPGPLSVIVPKHPSIPSLVSAGGPTIAIRIPSHPVALKLLKSANTPIAAPSANPSGYLSPTSAEHVLKHLSEKVDMILDGGSCDLGLESTVVSIVEENVVILRPGFITKDKLEITLNESVSFASEIPTITENKVLLSPGLLESHYAPRTPLFFGSETKVAGLSNFAVICFNPNSKLALTQGASHVEILSEKNSEEEIANKLFRTLHHLDGLELSCILIDKLEEEGLGLAIMNRLKRAVGVSETPMKNVVN